ncbi:MAG: GHKL domain-containing protein, partial [Oscillospiraceae bacterium]|nr:GHKL domain-containing protein [Oscillospiraceae bacterium]
ISFVRVVSFIVTYFLLRRFFCGPFCYMLKNCDKGWGTLCAMPLLYYLVSYILEEYYFTPQSWEEFGIFKVIMLLMIFSTYMLTLNLFRQTSSQLALTHQQDVLKLQLSEMESSLGQLKQYRLQASVNRHDLHHHMQYISTCLANDDITQAQTYISKVCEDIQAVAVTQYCENDALNLILSSLVAKADSYHIESIVKVAVSEEIDISSTDLCIIFANSIENAINACRRIPEALPRKIKIDCHTKNGKVFFSVANTFQGYISFDEDGLPKCNRTGHGIGTKSIAAVIKKNLGLYEFKANHGIFTLNVIV